MLRGLLRSKEDQVREKVEQHLKDGMRMLGDKFYNGAMVEFDKAMSINPQDVYPRLKEELAQFAAMGNLESAVSIGLNLIKDNNRDFELANRLGNYARELKNYPQAEQLYKTALKAKQNYEPAFYNLAACMARVDKYDEAVISSVSSFNDLTDFVYPDFIGPEKILELMRQEIESAKEERVAEKIQELQLLKEQKLNEGATVEASHFDLDIKRIQEKALNATVEDFLDEFQRLIETDTEQANNHIYNLGLFSLRNNRIDIAEDAFKRLNEADYFYKPMLLNLCLAKAGKLEEGIAGMSRLLGGNEFNRYNNVNIGLMYKKAKKKFLATKYLIKTASLLEKSGGIYSMRKLVRQAHRAFEDGHFAKALSFYKIACTEYPEPLLWLRMGEIYREQKKIDEATRCYKELLAAYPDNEEGKAKLKEMHDYYFSKAEQLMHNMKFKPATDYVHKALGILRLPETVKKAAAIYSQLKNSEKEEQYLEEYRQMMDEVKRQEQEKERLVLLAEARACMSKKNYMKAIQFLESALRMKVDKQVFMQLAGLYKGLKKMNDLQDLIRRWEKMVEHQEKMAKFAKEQEREKTGQD